MSKSKNKHEYEIECKHYKTLYKKKSEQLFYMRRRLLKIRKQIDFMLKYPYGLNMMPSTREVPKQ